MSAVRARKRQMVAGLVDMNLDNFKSSGSELVIGSGRFVGPKTLEVSLLGRTHLNLYITAKCYPREILFDREK